MLLDTPQGVEVPGDYTCGPESLRVMLGFHGIVVPRQHIALASPDRGMSDETLEAVVRALCNNVAVGRWGLEELAHFTRMGRPVVCLVSVDNPADHWVCVRGCHAGRVHYHDPAEEPRRRSLPAAEFLKWWDGPKHNNLFRLAVCGWPT